MANMINSFTFFKPENTPLENGCGGGSSCAPESKDLWD